MNEICSLKEYVDSRKSAVTLGKFDGFHRGHQRLLQKVMELQTAYGVTSVVCAFDMAPLREKKGLAIEELMTKDERRCYLEGKVDTLVQCPFTERFSRISAEDFIKEILCGIFHARYVVVGADFRFGYEKRGNVDLLRRYADSYEYEVFVIEKETYQSEEISSSRIRRELRKGNLEDVNAMLGYAYTISGSVEYGKKLGRKIGVPTMNVQPAAEKMLPPRGVYASRIKVDGNWHAGIGNIGYKPTVTDERRMLIESYLFEYSGNAYEKSVEIQLYQFRRPEKRFASVEEMTVQIHQDIKEVKEYFWLDS